jgi:hypothetical protein
VSARSFGSNRALSRLFRMAGAGGRAAPPLSVAAPDDALELEADRVADAVMRVPAGAAPPAVGSSGAAVQRKCAACEEEQRMVQRAAVGAGPVEAPPAVHAVLGRAGRPLDGPTRSFFEPRLGADLSGVRVHDDAEAAASARAVSARAYTVGGAIAFGAGEYAPHSDRGQRLLAHELTHVLQQGGAAPRAPGPFGSQVGAAQRGVVQRQDDQNQGDGSDAGTPAGPTPVSTPAAPDANTGAPAAPQTDVDRIVAALQEPQENGVGNYQSACAILDGMWIVVMFQTLEELRKRGFLDLLRGDVCPNMPRVKIAVDAVTAKASPPVTWQFANDHPAFGDLPDQQKQETATYLALPWPIPADPSAPPSGAPDGEIIVGILVGAALIAGLTVLLVTPGGQAIVAAALISLAPVSGEAALATGIPVAAEIATGSLTAAGAAGAAGAGGTAAAVSATTPLLVTTAVAAPTTAGATATTVAASSWAATTAAALGTALTATTLSSDNPPKPKDDQEPQSDGCQNFLGLAPGINARWHIQRPPISGQTTVLAAAFRLDAGVAPPPGQSTAAPQRAWVRSIGQPDDDAGHVIANRFGGTNDFNSAPDGNIFPQDLSFNRGTMNSYDAVAASLHDNGCDVCVHIELIYDSPTALRPSAILYTYLYRSAGATGFNPPIPATVPNP